MTIHKEDATDVDPIQIWSTKDLDNEFTPMLKAYADKETEFNWEAREKAITRMRGLLRGNAVEPPYIDTFIPYMRQMIDGIIKAVESLRTQLAVKALSLVGDIGPYIGKHLDSYMIEQIMMCMMRCASLTKKMVANASLEATKSFLKHTPFHLKVTNMLNLAINEKNSQVRLYTILYTKIILQAHAHRDNVRALMDRSYATDHFETILSKGLNDPTPAVKETCREAFWIFWVHWREKGEHIIKNLPPAAQKQLEKSKSSIVKQQPSENIHQSTTNTANHVSRSLLRSSSPTMLPRASSSLERRENSIHLSPSNSTASNGSAHSIEYQRQIKRSASPRGVTPRAMSPRAMSPRAMSPHLRAYASPPTASISSQLTQHHSNQQPHHQNPSTSTSSTGRKTRVPTLARKKSSIGFLKKAKPHFMALLTHEDPVQFNEGLLQLAKKLSAYTSPLHLQEQQQDGFSMTTHLKMIQLEVPQAPPVDGETIKKIVAQRWDQDSYEILSSWEGITNILFKVFTFDEIIPKLIIDANRLEQQPSQQHSVGTTASTATEQYAQLGFDRAKLFLYTEHPNLTETVFASLIQYGGFLNNNNNSNSNTSGVNKKDITRLPANRRKLTKHFLKWMDELLKPLIGLPQQLTALEDRDRLYEGVPDQYVYAYQTSADTSTCSSWFRSEENLRQCMAILLPLITTSTTGTIWHAPLVTFLKHLRLFNQHLFEAVVSTYDSYSINKIGRVLGVHIRAVIDTSDHHEMNNSEPIQQSPTTTTQSEQTIEVELDEANNVTEGALEEKDNASSTPKNQQELTKSTTPLVKIDKVLYHNSTSPVVLPLEENEENQLLLEKLNLNQNTSTEQQQQQQQTEPIVASESQSDNSNSINQTSPISYPKEYKKLIPELQKQHVASNDNNLLHSERNGFFDTVAQMKQEQIQRPAVGLVTAAVPDPQPINTNNILYFDDNNPLGLSGTTPNPVSNRYQNGVEDASTVLDLRTASEEAATEENHHSQSTEQQNKPVPQQIILQPSTPNLARYPEPCFVPFYAPERVNFPNPVFQHHVRSQNNTHSGAALVMSSSTQTSSFSASPTSSPLITATHLGSPGSQYINGANGSGGSGGNSRLTSKDKTVLLYVLIDKLRNSNPTSTTTITATFRKLTRLFKEVPIRRRWDQGGMEEAGSETWAGAHGEEAGNFVEVVQAILPYLIEEVASGVETAAVVVEEEQEVNHGVPVMAEDSNQQQQKIILVALESIRQLAVTQAGLFRFYERKVDDKGRTLESQLMERLLQIRSSENPTVCIAAEDALDAVLGTLNPPTVFEMLMAYVVYRLILSPSIQLPADARYHPVGSAFTYLCKWVKELNDHFYIDEWLTSRGAVNAFFKGINHSRINVRKSCVEALVAFHEVLGDALYEFFTDLREDQLALLKHYAAKASKKKTTAASAASAVIMNTPMLMRRDNTNMAPSTVSF